jgi:Mrp family chromosome partitioning ATPase
MRDERRAYSQLPILLVPMTGYAGMDLARFMALMRARWRLIAAIVLGAFVLAALVSLLQPDRYTASADLLFGRTTNADAIIAGGTTDTGELPERAAATNLALASLDTVAVRVAKRLPDETVEELQDAVSINAEGESDLVTVTARSDSPTRAAAVANAFADEIAAFRRETARADIQRAIDALRATLPTEPPAPGATDDATRAVRDRLAQLEALKALQTGNVQVVEAATPPQHRSSPTPFRNAVIAALAALLLGVFLVVFRARFEDRVGDEEELTALMEAPVLARIPQVRDSQHLTDAGSSSEEPAFAEAFGFLRLNLDLIGHDGDVVVVAVTSPAAADGKTTVVAGLARSLALSGAEVVAVDLDLRKPELHAYLHASSPPGRGVLQALLESGFDGNDNGEARSGSTSDGRREFSDPELLDEEPATHGRRYSEEDIAAGLVELARWGGHARPAARSLKGSGRNIPESTLRRWKEVHAETYADIQAARGRGTLAAPHLRLLAGNSRHQIPTGLVAPGRLRRMFDHLRREADYVLVDTVPVSTVADASAVAAAADGVILVVDLNRTRRRDLLTAKKQLANARARVLGMVLNRAEVHRPTYQQRGDERKLERAASGA